MSRRKKITLAVSATTLALGLSLGATTMASATSTPPPAPSARTEATQAPKAEAGHGKAEHIAAALASKLGVDEAKVLEALRTFRDANKTDDSAKEAALAKSLAASLGIDEAKVTAAIHELHSKHQKTDHTAALKTRLDKAVTSGKLTQAEADAVAKAVEKGVFGGARK